MAAATFNDLMAMIGNLLVAWGWTESALNEALAGSQISKSDLTSKTFASRVDLWHAELLSMSDNARVKADAAEFVQRISEIRQLRNLICHHLQTARVKDGAEPFVVTAEDGDLQPIPYSVLERAYDDLVRYRGAFQGLIDIARDHPH